MKKMGIDISYWQKGINLAQAKKEGVEFVVLRGAYSTSKDKAFDEHYAKAKANGLPVGVYVFTKAKNKADAVKEANFCIENVLKGKKFELPIFIDMENENGKPYSVANKAVQTEIVIAFCETLEKNGYFAGIYSSPSWLASYLDDSKLQRFTHWVAQWASKCTYKGNDGVLGMWQYGGETNKIRSNKIAGMVCDQNYMLVDYPTMIKSKGMNGYPKSAEPKKEEPKKEEPKVEPKKEKPAKSAKPTQTEQIYVVKAGDTLSGIASRYGTTYQALASYNGIKNTKLIYVGQQIKIPNANAPAYDVTDIAKRVIRGEFGSGNDRRIRLARAGYDYNTIQARVNELMK